MAGKVIIAGLRTTRVNVRRNTILAVPARMHRIAPQNRTTIIRAMKR